MINGYVAAGYLLIWASILAYAWRTRRRLRQAEHELATFDRQANEPSQASHS